MPKQISAVEVNNFVAGLITEANPLTFPENASLYEQNFVLHKDGSRSRRKGLDYEEDFNIVSTSVSLDPNTDISIKSFKWENAGGSAGRTFIVVQVGNEIKVFDSASALSSSLLYTTKFDQLEPITKDFSFTVVDGILVIATGSPELYSLEFTDGQFSLTSYRLQIRDFFGVEDFYEGQNLLSGTGVSTRPTNLTPQHIYNLRNQTWALPRKVSTSEATKDLLYEFHQRHTGSPRERYLKYPSNADVVTYSLYPDANNESDRITDRFNARDVIVNPIGTTQAPRGYFIIDLLERGKSRLEEESKLRSENPELQFAVSTLPQDYTPGGATLIAQYSGRVFYAGFSGDVLNGDGNSPRLSSYILFSKLVDDLTDLKVCYQVGDPTSKEEPDLLDTDGGFIRIDGAYGIRSLVVVEDGLMVVAANGVWKVQGGSDYGFKATNYLVTKLTDYGCLSPSSVVMADNTLMYWSEDGIYAVAKNQFGDYVADNITLKTIQTMYLGINTLDKMRACGNYDPYEKKVSWIYNNRVGSTNGVTQLNLDLSLGAFYPYVFATNSTPKLHSGVSVPPFLLDRVEIPVSVEGVTVTAGGEVVGTGEDVQRPALSSIKYLVLTSLEPTISYTFATYSDTEFRDYKSLNGVGVDAKAALVTGYMTGGDTQRNKQAPYVTFHFMKTEDGFTGGADEDWIATNQSSCWVRCMWDWSNHINSGKWSQPFQAYRFKRWYAPSNQFDTYDNGFRLVTTKNRLRGIGKALSLSIESEEYKDMHLLGWAMIVGVNGNV